MPDQHPPEPVPDQLVRVPGDRPYMLIVPTDEGFVQVRGPLNNPGLCYDWLGQAFEYILRRNLERVIASKGIDLSTGLPGTGDGQKGIVDGG